MAKFTDRNQFVPDWIPCPGETIREILDDMAFSQNDLARRMNRSLKFINELIQGKAALSEMTALQLERVLGVKAYFWLGLEQDFQLFQTQQKEKEKMAELKDWADEFPYKQMASFGWLEYKKDVPEKVQTLLEFFGIATPDAWDSQWAKEKLCASFRSSSYTIKVKSMASWLRQGQRLAAKTETGDYNRTRFSDALKSIRNLTSMADPAEFMPQLENACAGCGVVTLFIPPLSETTVSGAAHWYSGKPIIQLTLRYKKNDHLWFSFFHEAKHILSHSTKEIYINEINSDSKEESEANEFAANFLIPLQNYNKFLSTWDKRDLHAIKNFAESIGIHPGIVVGRLQHDKKLNYSQGDSFKISYKWPSNGP